MTDQAVPTRDAMLTLVRRVFAETLPDRDVPADDAPLFGPEAQLDSMELVAFVADVEDALEDELDAELILADEKALSRRRSPFRSLTALAEYVVERLTHG